jgi:hypothetical protein
MAGFLFRLETIEGRPNRAAYGEVRRPELESG